jgi:thiamine kinase-like enzyme
MQSLFWTALLCNITRRFLYLIPLFSPFLLTSSEPLKNLFPNALHIENLHSIGHGASNKNYRLNVDEKTYFIKWAPENLEKLFASKQLEYQVLEQLSPFHLAPVPYILEEDDRLLVMDYIEIDDTTIDLTDPTTRLSTFAILHKIANLNITINRQFQPFTWASSLLEIIDSLEKEGLDQQFIYAALQALKKIERHLENLHPKSLCHLDLHHENIIKNKGDFLIIDWEYASMAHPLLSLASMASIERWNDSQMNLALEDFYHAPTKEDFTNLYLLRLSVDLFWMLWNHIQWQLRPEDHPYYLWRDSYYNAASKRLQSSYIQDFLQQAN